MKRTGHLTLFVGFYKLTHILVILLGFYSQALWKRLFNKNRSCFRQKSKQKNNLWTSVTKIIPCIFAMPEPPRSRVAACRKAKVDNSRLYQPQTNFCWPTINVFFSELGFVLQYWWAVLYLFLSTRLQWPVLHCM